MTLGGHGSPGSPDPPGVDLAVRDLGSVAYAEALTLQRRLQQAVIDGRADADRGPMHLLLLEHAPPVITVSRRREARRHLHATPERLDAAGVEVVETDRGGDITYHGPGQLVAYPIIDLNVLGLRIHSYMRFLEEVVIRVLARFAIDGCRDHEATGVWVGEGSRARKICAMGVRVSRWVSMHGLALNVTTDLDHFDLIVPCGLHGREVTSMERELRSACPTMDDVKRVVAREFEAEAARLVAARPA